MPDVGAWIYTSGGVLKRRGRPDRAAGPSGVGYTRPSGAGYYAIEDLGKPLTVAGFNAAMAQVKGLATGVDSGQFGPAGRIHRTLTLPGTTTSPLILSATGFGASANNAGFIFEEGVGVVGSGPGATDFRVTPDTITQAQVDAWYPGDVYPSTIGLKVIISANGYAARAGSLPNVRYAQFSVTGTQQRVGGTGYPTTLVNGWNTYHYNGISASRNDGDIWEDIKVSGIPGYKNSPPGETFGFTKFRGLGATFRRVEVDGRNGLGTKVGAAGIATNTTQDILIEDCFSHHMGFSHGYAFWETNNIDVYDSRATDNGSVGGSSLGGVSGDGFNFERSRDTRLIRCTVGNNTLAELRYYGRNDGDSYDGDTFPHYIEDLTLLEGNLDIWIDSGGTAGSVQTTRPTLVRSPSPVFTVH